MAVKRLGKGLGALIPEIAEEEESRSERLKDIPTSQIKPNPFQPRESFDRQTLDELKQSIAENGIIQPISVRASNTGYELIAGERRLRAVQELNLDSIPAFVLDVSTDAEMMELSLIENIQRENLNPIDEANGFQALMTKCNLTQDEVAQKVGKDRSTITNAIRILKLPQQIQKSITQNEISAGHARALLAVSDQDGQIALWKKAVRGRLSVRQVEKLAQKTKTDKKARKPGKSTINPFLQDTEDRLRDALGTQVRIHPNSNGSSGKIEIEYYSDSDIDRILELMEKT